MPKSHVKIHIGDSNAQISSERKFHVIASIWFTKELITAKDNSAMT